MNFSGDTVGVDGIVLYRFQTSHYTSQREGSKGDGSRHGSRSEYINHLALFNVGESVDGIGRSGYMSQTSPSPSHNFSDCGRSSGFNIYGDNRGGNSYPISHFFAYNHGELSIYHPRLPQEYISRGVHG